MSLKLVETRVKKHKKLDPEQLVKKTDHPKATLGAAPRNPAQSPRPDFAGQRIASPIAGGAIYLVDQNGYKRHIPDPKTYDNLFVPGTNVIRYVDLNLISDGPSLDVGAVLFRAIGVAPVYILDQGGKRWITANGIYDPMAKYSFNWNAVVVIPAILVNAITTTAPWY
jgi:hypothetical protein